MARADRAFSLVETMVGLTVLSVVLVLALAASSLARRERETWEDRIDVVYELIHGLERLRRELEASRGVVFPPASDGPAGLREHIAVLDATGRLVVYSVVGSDLVAETLGPAGPGAGAARRVVMPATDRVIFHHRTDTLAVRFQVFKGGMTLVGTARPAGELAPAVFDFDDTYGL
jgi:prepilin-type N-terminal cleavage/methylation domain-containing protein